MIPTKVWRAPAILRNTIFSNSYSYQSSKNLKSSAPHGQTKSFVPCFHNLPQLYIFNIATVIRSVQGDTKRNCCIYGIKRHSEDVILEVGHERGLVIEKSRKVG